MAYLLVLNVTSKQKAISAFVLTPHNETVHEVFLDPTNLHENKDNLWAYINNKFGFRLPQPKKILIYSDTPLDFEIKPDALTQIFYCPKNIGQKNNGVNFIFCNTTGKCERISLTMSEYKALKLNTVKKKKFILLQDKENIRVKPECDGGINIHDTHHKNIFGVTNKNYFYQKSEDWAKKKYSVTLRGKSSYNVIKAQGQKNIFTLCDNTHSNTLEGFGYHDIFGLSDFSHHNVIKGSQFVDELLLSENSSRNKFTGQGGDDVVSLDDYCTKNEAFGQGGEDLFTIEGRASYNFLSGGAGNDVMTTCWGAPNIILLMGERITTY